MKMKITKKYYVGAQHIANGDDKHCHEVLANAIVEAKSKCESSGEPQIVVQIIRIIREKRSPIVVEKV